MAKAQTYIKVALLVTKTKTTALSRKAARFSKRFGAKGLVGTASYNINHTGHRITSTH